MNRTIIRSIGRLLLLAILMAGLSSGAISANSSEDKTGPLIVFAASSLAVPLEAIAAAYSEETGNDVRLSYASSAVLARQIERGAPAGLFISAHETWLSHVVAVGRADPAGAVTIAGNRLVLAAKEERENPTAEGLDILKALGPDERLSIGNPNTVPLGIYAREALIALGYWRSVEGHLVEAANARAAVALVQSGATQYGVLYASDVALNELIALAEIPADSYRSIRYRAVPTTREIIRDNVAGNSASAMAFRDFLGGDTARSIFIERGFTVPPDHAR